MSSRSPLCPRAVTVLLLLAGLLAVPAPALAAAPPPAPPPAPPLTGENLGPDRLPRCAGVVAAMPPRLRLAQRLMVGVEGDDPAAVAGTVRSAQVGGIFVGGNATELFTDEALRGVQAMARIPVAVAVDDEGGRVQRIDALDGDMPSAREMKARLTLPAGAGAGARARQGAARPRHHDEPRTHRRPRRPAGRSGDRRPVLR